VSFADRLDAAVRAVRNPCLVGIDPHLELLPPEFEAARDARAPRAARAEALARFCTELIDDCAGRVAAIKPQSAFFEVLGADGAAAWERVVAHAHRAGLLVIGDVKRGDIASTAAAYATAFLEGLPGADPASLCDAITINPYLGDDALKPFVEACARCGKGLFVLVRTSNPGSTRFQMRGDAPLAFEVADAVHAQGAALVGASGWSSLGAVVGATHADELFAFRERMPRAPFLVPGYGAQGATAADVVGAFREGEASGALINSSRAIAFAYRAGPHAGRPWREAARAALDDMIADVGRALAERPRRRAR
jgi:orotidine-5'-phosphate decarboxylase